MKKEEIEYEDVKLTEEEVRNAKYGLDDCKLNILVNKNKLELLKYNVDNDIPKSVAREGLRKMERDLEELEEKLIQMEKPEGEDFTGEEIDKRIILESTIKSCKQKIEEKDLEIKLGLPSRDLNMVISKTEEELKRFESGLKEFQYAIRNKTRKVMKPRIQLEKKSEESNEDVK